MVSRSRAELSHAHGRDRRPSVHSQRCSFITPSAAGAWQSKLENSKVARAQASSWTSGGPGMTAGPVHMTGHPGHLSKVGRGGDTPASLLAQCSLSQTPPHCYQLSSPACSLQGTFRLKVREGGNRRPPGLESGSTLSKPFTLSVSILVCKTGLQR